MQFDYEHWLEALLAGLVALGAWLWRVGRQYQRQEDRVRRLEEWRGAHMIEHGDESSRLARKLDEFNESQNRQNITLGRIESNQAHYQAAIADIRKDVRELRGTAMPGGRRHTDPPAGP